MTELIKKYSFPIVLLLTAAAVTFAVFQLLLPLDIFSWDESHHAFFAMMICNDIRHFDFGSFAAHTGAQGMWMPLHSWYEGLAFLMFGISDTVARCSNLFLFAVSSILIYLISLELSREKGRVMGLIASAAYLVAPVVLWISVLNYQEFLGSVISLLMVYYIIRNMSNERPVKYLVMGFCLSLLYWTRTNIGMHSVLAIGLFQLSLLYDLTRSAQKPPVTGADKRKVRQSPDDGIGKKLLGWMVNNLLIIAGFLPMFLLWWGTPPFDRKLGLAFYFVGQAVTTQAHAGYGGIFGRSIFYVQSIISSCAVSVWIGLGLLSSIIASFWFMKDKYVRLCLLMYLGCFIMMSVSSFMGERYTITVLPFVFILFGYASVKFFDVVIRSKFRYQVFIIAVALVLLVGYDMADLSEYTQELASRSSRIYSTRPRSTDSLRRSFSGLLRGRPSCIPL